jgi:hypothetical protein
MSQKICRKKNSAANSPQEKSRETNAAANSPQKKCRRKFAAGKKPRQICRRRNAAEKMTLSFFTISGKNPQLCLNSIQIRQLGNLSYNSQVFFGQTVQY